ncbi:MAG: Asp-tRNA(Asn)/Glu-tRNA(Gln) amidotransferase subunit GatC [Actinomycetota bacterium]|nr:Asp-tRNA(Asn)/Glu-tRNA(Gln) amidotransferase subunit GatC [Actinomycetota bacterium]
MAISEEEVEHIAKLSAFFLSDEEKKVFAKQLSEVLDCADVISEVDTSNVKPTSYITNLVNVLREDEVKPSLSIEEVMKNAPHVYEGVFKVPRII